MPYCEFSFYLFIYFLNCHKSLLFDSRERTWAVLAWRKVEMVLPEPPVPQRFTVWKWQEEPAVGRGWCEPGCGEPEALLGKATDAYSRLYFEKFPEGRYLPFIYIPVSLPFFFLIRKGINACFNKFNQYTQIQIKSTLFPLLIPHPVNKNHCW